MILDYPLHQYRLITRFADSFANFVGGIKMTKMWIENTPRLLDSGNIKTEVCHSLSSCMKAFVGWNTNEV